MCLFLSIFFASNSSLLGQCNLACNNIISVALGNTCEAEITPNIILEAEQDTNLCKPNAPDNFAVSVSRVREGNPIATSPNITSANVGEDLFVTVLHLPSNNFCTGVIRVIDDTPPDITCPADIEISCGMSTDTSATGSATALDCFDFTISYSDVFSNLEMTCNDISGSISRTFRVESVNGKSSSCVQTIDITRPDIDDVVFPPNRNGIDAPTLSCDSFGIDAMATGLPTINGTPIGMMNGLCGISASFRDRRIEDCGSSFTILRSWTVIDPCESRIEREDQVILVTDSDGPTITCRDTLRVGTTSLTDCTADVILPAAEITDNCSSSFNVVMETSSGSVNGNGGTISNLPEGFTTVTYRVTDDCSQQGTCQTVVNVVDMSPPVLVCEDEITVAVNDAGIGDVSPANMIISTDDNCCTNVTLDVRRMDASSSEYFDEVRVDCGDAGQTIFVINRGTDCNGNENICMVRVVVADNNAAEINCPAAVEVDCTDDVNNTSLTGTPTLMGICTDPNVQATFVDANSLNSCGTGSILRTWTAPLLGGGTASCTQLITITDPTPVQVDFPQDLVLNQCMDPDNLDPDDLNPPFREPFVSGISDCNDINVSHNDLPIISEGNNCAVIRRVWTVREICTNEIIRDTQRIIINDTQAPILTCPATQIISTGSDCVRNVLLDDVIIQGECLPDELSIFPSGDLGLGNFFANVDVGVYTMTYRVTDNCNNSSECSFEIRVEDTEAPDAQCLPSLTVNLDNSGMASVSGISFNDGSSDNCTSNQDLDFRVGPFPPQNVNVPPSGNPLVFICDDVGSVANLSMWVGDESGNFSFCQTSIQIADGSNACSTGITGRIAGTIQTVEVANVEEVRVDLENSGMPTSITGENGGFLFPQVTMGATYRVIAERNTTFKDGLSTIDIVMLMQYLTGRRLLEDAYQYIAADVTGDDRISIFDAIVLQKLILNLQVDVPGNRSWRFIPKDYQFSNPEKPFAAGFPEFMDIVNLEKDYMNADFVAVKVGDINRSLLPSPGVASIEIRSQSAPELYIPNLDLEAGESAVFDLRLSEYKGLAGLQTALHLDLKKVELVNVHSPLFNNGLVYKLESDGRLLISGVKMQENRLTDEDLILHLELKAKTDFQSDEVIKLISDRFATEVIYDNHTYTALNLSFKEAAQFSLQALPNPFDKQVNLIISNLKQGDLELIVWDASGRVVYQNTLPSPASVEQIQLDNAILQEKGVYIVKAINGSNMQVLKLIRQ